MLGLVNHLKYSTSYVKLIVSLEGFTQDKKDYHGNYTNSNLRLEILVHVCMCVHVFVCACMCVTAEQ